MVVVCYRPLHSEAACCFSQRGILQIQQLSKTFGDQVARKAEVNGRVEDIIFAGHDTDSLSLSKVASTFWRCSVLRWGYPLGNSLLYLFGQLTLIVLRYSHT